VRKLFAVGLIPLVFAAGCGGGGGGSSGGTTPPPPTPSSIATAGPPNVESVVVDAGPAGLSPPAVNTPYVSVEVCVPGTTTCQTIDHIEIDTGSVGLRLISSAVTVALPAETDSSNNPLAECLEFADNTASYGSLAVADIVLPVSGETASSVNVQLIGAASAGAPPMSCSGTQDNTVDSFGAKGILGVGPFIADCAPDTTCPAGSAPTLYYSCPTSTSCTEASVSATQQLPNPVSLFANDNNGVIVELPSISGSGAASPGGGVIVFGIGTESNNALGSATQLTADSNSGDISAMLNGTSYPASYIDSGSNANFFNDSSLATCPSPNQGFYCPSSTTAEMATLEGTNGTTLAATFNVANADTLFENASLTAFNDLGATAFSGQGSSLDLGLPYFFGENIFLAFETASNATPYFAIIGN
jgi:Protein of unknown function (DUF3443)